MKRNSTIRTPYFPAIRNRSPKFLVVFSETKFRRGRRNAVFRLSARSKTANPNLFRVSRSSFFLSFSVCQFRFVLLQDIRGSLVAKRVTGD